jgi:D-alanyl-D-alanine carboxypeptidase
MKTLRLKAFCCICIFLILLIDFSGCKRNNIPAENMDTAGTSEEKPEYIHPDFNFTTDSFSKNLTDINSAISENPHLFLSIASRMLKEDQYYLKLIDKKHPLPENLIPPELVNISDYSGIVINRNNMKLDRIAAESLNEMSIEAAASGAVLGVSSAYRSYNYQKNLFNRYVERDGKEKAEKYSAPPGCSQHQLGTAVDFGSITNSFAETPESVWLTNNAWEFGWSLSYPKGCEDETGYIWESWHWRWIGKDAVIMQNTFFKGVQQRMLVFWNKNFPVLKNAYKYIDAKEAGVSEQE